MEKLIDSRDGQDADRILHDALVDIVSSWNMTARDAIAGNALVDAILYIHGNKITPGTFTKRLF